MKKALEARLARRGRPMGVSLEALEIVPEDGARTDAGTGLLVKSSDPIELAGLCDRVLVMSRGTIVEEIPGDELGELRIVEAIVRGPGMSRAHRSPLGASMPKASPGGAA